MCDLVLLLLLLRLLQGVFHKFSVTAWVRISPSATLSRHQVVGWIGGASPKGVSVSSNAIGASYSESSSFVYEYDFTRTVPAGEWRTFSRFCACTACLV